MYELINLKIYIRKIKHEQKNHSTLNIRKLVPKIFFKTTIHRPELIR